MTRIKYVAMLALAIGLVGCGDDDGTDPGTDSGTPGEDGGADPPTEPGPALVEAVPTDTLSASPWLFFSS